MSLQNLVNVIVDADKRGKEVSLEKLETNPQMVEYAKKLNNETKEAFDYKKAPKALEYHLNLLTSASDKTFQFNENNKPVIRAIYQWFTKDPAFYGHTANFPEIFKNRMSLKKGILLIGGYGTGKTTIATAFQRVGFPGMQFKSRSCPDIADIGDYKRYIDGNWFFDEFGNEEAGKYEKKDAKPLMAKVLEERSYRRSFSPSSKTGFTIMTSNLDMVEIAEKYGGRVSDRIREMFNIILMLGDSYRS